MAKKNKEKDPNPKQRQKNFAKLLWTITALGVVAIIACFMLLASSDLPDFEQLENPDFEFASIVYANKGEELGRYFVENRVPVDFEELSPHLVNALVATEDERFYQHSGVDLEALGRVVYGVASFNHKGGGSTISQQLAKLLFDRPDLSGNKLKRLFTLVKVKFKEWITAAKLEKAYTKEEIIAMYLNKFSFNYGAYGIKAASEIYFNKSQKNLSIEEAATLVGMLNNPSLFNPIRRPDTVVHRRMIVLNQMMKAGHIARPEYDSLKVLPLDMSNFKVTSHVDGPAPYFRMELTKWLKKLLARKEYAKGDGSSYNIYRDGLKIYTTIDLKMQKIAEETMAGHMEKIQDQYWKVWKNKDPWTYDADSGQRKIRMNALDNLIKASDRYKSIESKYFTEINKTMKQKYDFLVSVRDMRRMLEEEKSKGALSRMVAKRYITSKRSAVYKKILEGDEWSNLKTVYKEMIAAVDKSFKTKRKMKVFAYNEQGEEEREMSPLDSIKYHRQIMQTGILAIEPGTGYIKTWVGGVNHKYFKFDHINSSRQVGSTFKPFVYATAIALQAISPCFPVVDQSYTIAPGDGSFGLLEPWTPRNSDDEYSGEVFTLYEGLQKSKNTVSVFLMSQLGNANLVRGLVHNMGIDSSTVRSDGEFRVPNAPSICLGSADLSVFEMTGAYTTFANNGLFNTPIFVSQIEDSDGRVIYKAVPESQSALPPKANYVMLDMLKYAGTNLGGIETEVGGKTGTTNNYVDGWFMGVTPSLVVGTWVGGEDPWIRFLTLRDGQGSVMAKPFFREFIKKIQNNKEVDFDKTLEFPAPEGDLGIVIDCDLYQRYNQVGPVRKDTNGIILEDEFIEEEEFEEEFDEDF